MIKKPSLTKIIQSLLTKLTMIKVKTAKAHFSTKKVAQISGHM